MCISDMKAYMGCQINSQQTIWEQINYFFRQKHEHY